MLARRYAAGQPGDAADGQKGAAERQDLTTERSPPGADCVYTRRGAGNVLD